MHEKLTSICFVSPRLFFGFSFLKENPSQWFFLAKLEMEKVPLETA